MANFSLFRAGSAALVLLALTACGSTTNPTAPLPEEPVETVLYDLVDGPIDRPSALNVARGRGTGVPSLVRVDASAEWDMAFGMLDGQPAWFPRGFFEGFEVSSGVLELDQDFDDVTVVPSDADAYEDEQTVAITVGKTYAIRSRSDPSFSLPCRIYAKAEVLAVEGDPSRMDFRILWNPNCDETNFIQN